uniref:Kinesin-associated microtubule-binding domain-containing protein n=1 Tax=Timema shepardi TaxID=629360 RepID=A0A7R9AZU7_TIMSH|nr:unnamed protein product [Timema shepardi]
MASLVLTDSSQLTSDNQHLAGVTAVLRELWRRAITLSCQLSYTSLQSFDLEYTEEIERLRQDLVSAREKSGVYLSIENYNKMITQMEQSEKEMSQKLSTIKLLNEQMEEKESVGNLSQITQPVYETRAHCHSSLLKAVGAELANSENNIEILTEVEWKQAAGIVEVLGPLADATKEINKALKSRFSFYDSDPIFCPSMLCDPRFRGVLIDDMVAVNTLAIEVKKLSDKSSLEPNVKDEQPSCSSSSSGLWSSFDSIPNTTQPAIDNNSEVKDYLNEPRLICQQLNMKLERRTQRLQETHQTLCVTKRERDETAHLLERHMQTEEVLGDQARTLLSVAEESSKDTYRLHDKLSRKRSVESENEDIIVNFHRNMNHDLSLLEGSLEQFLQVYHKYKSGMESNIGDHLEDGVAHLIGLSNEMSTLVESHNKIMQQLKKGSSERVHDSKRMIQVQLASLRQTCDLESNKLHTFHIDSASPGIQNILYFLELQKTVTATLNQLSNNQLSLMMKLMEDHVSQVKQIVSSVKENHRALVASVKKREEDFHKFREAVKDKDKRDAADLTSAMTQQIAMMTQLMSNIKAKSDEVAQMAKQAEEEEAGAGKTIEILSNTIITDLDKSVLNEPDVVERFSQERMEVFTVIEEAVERSSTYMSEARRYLDDLKNEMVATLTSGVSAWRKHYTHTEQDLRTHLECLGSGLQDELELTAQLADVVRVCANNNEAALERRRHTLTTFVRERQDDIVAECSYVSDWTRRTVAEVQQRAQELDRFLTEDLRKDLPTGQTPQRKEFHYPHQLVATSPHDRILERFRAHSEAMMGDTQPMLDLSLEESSSSSASDYSDLLAVTSTSRVEQEKLQAKAGPRKAASTNDVNMTGSNLELNRSTVSEPELGKSYNTTSPKHTPRKTTLLPGYLQLLPPPPLSTFQLQRLVRSLHSQNSHYSYQLHYSLLFKRLS